ncbi:hypothetical protein CSC3H3_10500 [Thalassospira marina]|uniref:Uncharacterized protein n=1 Tax=Thalassospira marina TaxID=2048283 RepID=A0ABM6Q996_9PROT|nr:hypothetical protein CSC3H3_10500 [Thalassospira marina]
MAGLEHVVFNLYHFVCFWRTVWQGTAFERCGASVKRCNAAKCRQNQPLRAKTVSGKMMQIKCDVLYGACKIKRAAPDDAALQAYAL